MEVQGCMSRRGVGPSYYIYMESNTLKKISIDNSLDVDSSSLGSSLVGFFKAIFFFF
jgi:hypothetical protein